ncbi:hypothetical protein NDU88_002156 [Pleurodeles waltl]|uniref:Uncharacterized protein n=1 Tax=Pleurodeles waltl TaxID=8319 RepID=A0AAV7VCE3_PLEWA|nr:hypothetical protein NDU88_002156 [Pleurodeles waltl]
MSGALCTPLEETLGPQRPTSAPGAVETKWLLRPGGTQGLGLLQGIRTDNPLVPSDTDTGTPLPSRSTLEEEGPTLTPRMEYDL